MKKSIGTLIATVLLFGPNNVVSDEMEEAQPMIIPALGRPFILGALYNEPEDHVILGLSLWDVNNISKQTFERDLPNVKAKILTKDRYQNLLNEFGLSAHIGANLKKYKIEIHGSANVFVHQAHSAYDATASFVYRRRTHMKEITMQGLQHVGYPNVFDLKTGATHAVTAIEYGAIAVFRLTRHGTNFEDILNVSGSLSFDMKAKFGEIHAKASLNLSHTDKIRMREIECHYMGDVNLPKPPVTYEDALIAYQNLSKVINKTTAVPLMVHLTPLSLIDSKASRLVRRISESLLNQVIVRTQRYDDLEDLIADLKVTSAYATLPIFLDQVDSFESAMGVHKAEFQKKLLHVLPRIRGGGAAERELADALDESNQYIAMDQLEKYLKRKLMEAGALAESTSAVPEAIVSAPGAFERMLFNDTIRYILSFTFLMYGEVEMFTECVKNGCNKDKRHTARSTFCSTTNCFHYRNYKSWTANRKISEEMSSAFSQFKRAVDYNKNWTAVPPGWRTASVIRAMVRNGSDPKMFGMELFVQARRVGSDVKLPVVHDIVKKDHNRSGFNISWETNTPDTSIVTNKYLVQYHYPGLQDWTNTTVHNKTAFINSPCDVEVRVGLFCFFGVCADDVRDFPGVYPNDTSCEKKENASEKHEQEEAHQEQSNMELFNKTRIVFVGGQGQSGLFKTILVYSPSKQKTDIASLGLDKTRLCHTASVLGSGRILITGGSVGAAKTKRKANEEHRIWKSMHNKLSILAKKKNGSMAQKNNRKMSKNKTRSAWENKPYTNTNEKYGRSMLIDIDRDEKHQTQSADMTMLRCGASSAVIKDHVYVCGGCSDVCTEDKLTPTASCEVFSDGLWLEGIDKMTKERAYFALISTNKNELFAIGGQATAGGPGLKEVEKLNVQSGGWESLIGMNTGRYGHSATFLDGIIYVCGGSVSHKGERYTPTCESYNTTKGNKEKWQKIKSLNIAKRSFSLLALADGQLYAIGGYARQGNKKTGDFISFTLVDVYNPGSDKWTLNGEMSEPRFASPAVILPERSV